MKRNRWSLTIVALAAGAVVAGTLVVPGGAAATQDQPVIAGNYNDATFETTVENTSTDGIGMGVLGNSYGLEAAAGAEGGTAIYALSDTDTGIGVEGDVFGSGSAIYGNALGAGVGVNGLSETGVGVLAHASKGAGTALKVVGKTSFSRSSVVTIAAGASSRTVHLAGVTAATMVLATAQQAAGVYVKAAVSAAGMFSIKLTGPAPTGGLKVAYFVLN